MRYFCLVVLFLISSLAFANDESKKFILSENFDMMRTNIDYSYESHVDIPYDLYGENKHVDRRLNEDEQAKYYKDPISYMRNVARTDWQRAFEMSMYYQGWKPNTVFYRFDFIMRYNEFNYIPTTDDMRFNERKVLDDEKALYWAEIAFDLIQEDKYPFYYKRYCFKNIGIIMLNLLYLYDQSNLETKNEKITKILNSSDVSNSFLFLNIIKDEFKNREMVRFDDNEYLCTYLALNTDNMFWRNYYCGFIFPKNRNFSNLLLLSNFIKFDQLNKKSLEKISSGFYDKGLLDVKSEKYWKNRARFERIMYIHNTLELWQSESTFLDTYIFPLTLCTLKEFKSYGFYNRYDLTFKNPFYDKDKAMDLLKKEISESEINEVNYIIEQFIKNAPEYGIDEKVYDKMMGEIYKSYKGKWKKEDEESARDWFNGRIPDAYDYR